MTSVNCERAIGSYNAIKTDSRASLKVSSAEILTLLNLEAPSVSTCPYDEAFKVWTLTKQFNMHFLLEQLSTQPKAFVEAAGKARGYLKMLLNQDVMMFAHFETDVISLLSKLSQFMQQETCLVSDIIRKLHATVDVLMKYKTRYGQ